MTEFKYHTNPKLITWSIRLRRAADPDCNSCGGYGEWDHPHNGASHICSCVKHTRCDYCSAVVLDGDTCTNYDKCKQSRKIKSSMNDRYEPFRVADKRRHEWFLIQQVIGLMMCAMMEMPDDVLDEEWELMEREMKISEEED